MQSHEQHQQQAW